MTMIDETPATRLRVGADYIENHFTRGALLNSRNNVCAMGAIMRTWEIGGSILAAAAWPDDLPPVVMEAVNALTRHLVRAGWETQEAIEARGLIPAIETWNDCQVWGGAEAAAAMRSAADEWEAEHASTTRDRPRPQKIERDRTAHSLTAERIGPMAETQQFRYFATYSNGVTYTTAPRPLRDGQPNFSGMAQLAIMNKSRDLGVTVVRQVRTGDGEWSVR